MDMPLGLQPSRAWYPKPGTNGGCYVHLHAGRGGWCRRAFLVCRATWWEASKGHTASKGHKLTRQVSPSRAPLPK